MGEGLGGAATRWPAVPAVYGWLRLDRRGRWLLRDPEGGVFGPIGNAALNGFIARHYFRESGGRWYFQNGPQRVYVALDYAPLVVRLDEAGLRDHCGRSVGPAEPMLDDEGSVLFSCAGTLALLDDRDLAAYADLVGDAVEGLPRVARASLAGRFGFDPAPRPPS